MSEKSPNTKWDQRRSAVGRREGSSQEPQKYGDTYEGVSDRTYMRVWEIYMDLALICGDQQKKILRQLCFIVQQMKPRDNGRRRGRDGVKENQA